MDIVKIGIVALISISPVGEVLIAIPAGTAMGLPVFVVAAVAIVANFLPVPVLFFIFDQGNKYPKIQSWLLKRRNEKVKRWMDKYGILGLFILTPWIGVYAATITCELLGVQRSRICAAVAASLMFYAVILTIAITFGLKYL
ncbi:MAG: small multi-drug export protein [Euryarchaeota archaeon]|nr:small multi-drug export protein [Euryarchaeota archaeon]MBU4492401.1 small multi-drug export protein [Euryarchaeota archaeon]MCG2727751.1 small multi-drug export protein [Candidatus Methanoperedenaceae archaeon]